MSLFYFTTNVVQRRSCTNSLRYYPLGLAVFAQHSVSAVPSLLFCLSVMLAPASPSAIAAPTFPIAAFTTSSPFNILQTRHSLPTSSRRTRKDARRRPQVAVALPPTAALLTITAAASHRAIPDTLRGPPTAFLVSALLANLSLLPTHANIYTTLVDIAPTAVSLLLLQPYCPESTPTPRPVIRNLIAAFAVGAFGTILGALLSALPCFLPGQLRWQVAAAFAATYIGGSVNYVAIVNLLQIPGDFAAAGLAADLALMALYFGALFALATRIPRQPSMPTTQQAVTAGSGESTAAISSRVVSGLFPAVLTGAITLTARAVATLVRLPSGLDLLLMCSVAVLLSRVGWLKERLRFAGKLADVAVTAFFGALGATTRLSAVLNASPAVVIMAAGVLAVHAVSMFLVGKCLMRLPTRELLVASNANIGGASTAAAFAAAFGWRNVIPGAVLVGSLGYLVGTPVGLAIFWFARRAL